VSDCGIANIPCERPITEIIVVNETPIGIKNCFNNSFRTVYPFINGTLEVYIDGIKIDQIGYLTHIDLQGFTFLIDETDSKKLNRPITNIETLTVNYLRSTLSTCISTL
jgi:hypothetical protein